MEITRPVPSPNPVEQTDAALLQTAEEVSDAVFRSVPLPPLMREHFWVQSSVFSFYGRHVPKLRSLERRFVGMQFPAGRIRGVQAGRRQPFGGDVAACRFRTLQDGIRQFYAGKIPGRPFCRRNDAQRWIRRMPVRTCGVLALRPYDGGIQSDTVEGAFVRLFGYSRNPGRRYRIVRAERFESQCAAGFGAGASSGTGNRGVIVI